MLVSGVNGVNLNYFVYLLIHRFPIRKFVSLLQSPFPI